MNRTFSLNNVNHQPQQPKIVEIDLNKTISSSSSSSSSSTSSASSPTSMHNNNNELKQHQTIFSPKSTTSSSNSHPKRRTPRNAEEFLEAAGIDSDYFVNKGYYVGSMYNLNQQQPIIKTETKQEKLPKRSLSLLKRNASLKETSSMSLANLNLFNQQSSNAKKFTELSLFNEYFIDKTYKYVNQKQQQQQQDEEDEVEEVKNVNSKTVKNDQIILKPTSNGKNI